MFRDFHWILLLYSKKYFIEMKKLIKRERSSDIKKKELQLSKLEFVIKAKCSSFYLFTK